MVSPSSTRATKRRRSSITELTFHGINTSRQKAKSVTHVSGTKCHPCPRPHTVSGGANFAPPHWPWKKAPDAVYHLIIEVRQGDVSTLEARIAWNSVRQGLRGDLNA